MSAKTVLRRTMLLILTILPLSQAIASTDYGTLTVAKESNYICIGGGSYIWYGFWGDGWFGSYSPPGLSGGETVMEIRDTVSTCRMSSTLLEVAGFKSNPGANWLSSITCNDVEHTGSTADFSYGGGIALWVWNNGSFLLSNKTGENVSCAISHVDRTNVPH